MNRTSAQRFWPSLLTLCLLWLVVYGPGLFRPTLFDDADASHIEAGREMLVRHDWVTLHQNGIRYLEKAPLPYWGVALGFKLFGISEFSARIALHLSVLAIAIFLYFFAKRFLTAKAGFWAAVVFLTSVGPYIFTRIAIPDVTIGLWLGLGLYFFFDGWRSGHPSLLSCWGLAATIALNVLTKSLIGIVFPCAIIFIFLLLVGDLRHILKMRLISSTLVFLVIAAPWHILAALRNPAMGESKGFLWFYFVNEQFLRYLGKRYPVDYGTVPLLLFYGLLFIWFLPWSPFLPQATAQVRLRLLKVAGARQSADAVLLLLFCWAAVILLFFSFSTRQEYYLAPTLPAFAVLIGYWLSQEEEAQIGAPIARAGRVSATVFLIVGLLIAGVTMALALLARTPAPGTDLADLLDQRPGTYVLSMAHFLDLTGDAMGLFRGPLIGTAVAFLLGAGLNWYFRRNGKTRAANWALVGLMLVFVQCVHVSLGKFAPILGSQPLAAAIQRQIQPGEQIVDDGEYALASSVNFYTRQQMLIWNGRINGLWYGSLFPDAPRIFLDDAQFAQLWSGPTRVYLVTGKKKRFDDLSKLGPVYPIAKAGGKFVYSNRTETSQLAGDQH